MEKVILEKPGPVDTSDERRIKSLDERYKKFMADKKTIKAALSGKNLVNTKIKFTEDTPCGEAVETNADVTVKNILFDESSDDELEPGERFRSDKPKEFIELQSKFATDTRFTLDDRFYDKRVVEEDEAPVEEEEVQMNVLESVLGHQIARKKPVAGPSMIRYNPLRDEGKDVKVIAPNKCRTQLKANELNPNHKINTISTPDKVDEKVLKSKFYKVEKNFKNLIGGANFSMLDSFGVREENPKTSKELNNIPEVIISKKRKVFNTVGNPFRYDSSESDGEDLERERASTLFQRIQVDMDKEKKRSKKFFFSVDDPRFRDGLDFSKGGILNVSHQEFEQRRKELKSFIRSKANKNALKATKEMKKVPNQKSGKKRFLRLKKEKSSEPIASCSHSSVNLII